MKNIIITIILSTQLFSMDYGNYKCTVDEIVPFNGTDLREFDVKPSDKDTYMISYTSSKLSFTNIVNQSKGTFTYSHDTDNFKVYEDTYYQFKMSTNDNRFVFGVYKANYQVDYVGDCTKQLGK